MPSVFPSLPGLAWSVTKEPQFKTKIQKGVSGREFRLNFQPLPTWLFKLKFEFLRDKHDQRQGNWGTTLDELRTLMGFFLTNQGSLSSFYLNDPTDNTITAQVLGTADGSTRAFQLIRTMGGFAEPIVAPNVLSAVYKNGIVDPGTYVLSPNGVITFNIAPVNGTVISADFSYYFLVRFADDTTDFENFLYQLWSVAELKLQSVLV